MSIVDITENHWEETGDDSLSLSHIFCCFSRSYSLKLLIESAHLTQKAIIGRILNMTAKTTSVRKGQLKNRALALLVPIFLILILVTSFSFSLKSVYAADDDPMCAIVYSNGELVIQRGSEPDPAMGEVKYVASGIDQQWSNWLQLKNGLISTGLGTGFVTKVTVKDAYTLPADGAQGMFSFNFRNLKEIDGIEKMDTSKVTNMIGMFEECVSLESLDLTSWDFSNVTMMNNMFQRTQGMRELKIAGEAPNLNPINGLNQAFNFCGVEVLDLSDFHAPFNGGGMVFNLPNLVHLDVTGLNGYRQGSYSGSFSSEFKSVRIPSELILEGSMTFRAGPWIHLESGSVFRNPESLIRFQNYYPIMRAGTYIRVPNSANYDNYSIADQFDGYCINMFRQVPLSGGSYTETDGTDAILSDLLDAQGSNGTNLSGDDMEKSLVTLLYYGWRGDGNNIQEKYGLTDEEYYFVTQVAIWNLTNYYDNPIIPGSDTWDQAYPPGIPDRPENRSDAADVNAAYNELISKKYSDAAADAGKGLKLKVKVPTEGNYQNLIDYELLGEEETRSIPVTKVWEDSDNASGNRPESIEVQLFSNGVAYGDPVELSDENEWTYTWENLSVTDTCVYTVSEVRVPEPYTSEMTGSADEGFIITNTIAEEEPTPAPEEPETPGPSDKPEDKTTDSKEVKTGDEQPLLPFALLAACALVTMVVVIVVRKKQR